MSNIYVFDFLWALALVQRSLITPSNAMLLVWYNMGTSFDVSLCCYVLI
jgi:hypothetical protein